MTAARPTCSLPNVYRWEVALKNPPDLLPGTLDLLVLRTLTRGPMHGYGIAQRVKEVSREVLQVGESSLYPALQRLLLNGWVKAAWGASENNRRAETLQLILDVYPDDVVTALLAESFTSVLRRPLTFHLGQAGLSFRNYRQIASLLKPPA